MWRSILIWSVFCACATTAAVIKVSVYYETLCPDSVRFLTRQFYPTYLTNADLMDIDLIPFGKASFTNETGSWTFICQHGPAECYGNKVHACAIHLHPGPASTEFVVCAMASTNASDDTNLQQCATDHNISWRGLQECLDSGLADDLLVAHGERTYAVEPNITFIPTIVHNNIFTAPLQNLSLTNFQNILEFLSEETDCDLCHFKDNAASSFRLSIVGVSLFIFFLKVMQ